ncbi:hypothetical protein RRG08_064546 [Elysia crispata]|uniref:Transposable element P transposase-like RNase H domain-containing protein n=1 Tax=Elysia crispata TaxID=231223 RepID=A0AAE1B9B8_9GAST|nr:hypothetical protein RRG08_064546 [Elysia crispata]
MRNINLRPGICEQLHQIFKMKVAVMSDLEKICALVIDEMALKKPLSYDSLNDKIEGIEDFGSLGRTQLCATEALVVMVRGIVFTWKQPLAYYLSSGPTKTHMLETVLKDIIIIRVRELGLNPKGTNNQAVVNKLGINRDKPYFLINDEKIFVMFDPPHLLKSIRNNLKKSGFTMDGKIISWKYIEMLYERDSKFPIRMVPN